jgi:Bacterial SH3 domain
MRRAAPLLALALTGCLFGSPSASPTSTAPSAAPSVSVGPTTSLPPPTPTVAPTPGPDKIPTYTAGTKVATNAAGLRVRSGPGTSKGILVSLPSGSKLVVELGPVRTDGYGWYLVRDADAADPKFEEGWVAAGFMPDPFLVPATFDLPFNPIVAGFAHDGDGQFGPVRLLDANYAVTWVASAPDTANCDFAVDLTPGTGTAVPGIRATIGAAPAPGNLYGQFFAAHPELIGDVFVKVTTGCSWALTFLRTGLVPGA